MVTTPIFLSYRTPNIGDDIQTLAAMQHHGIDFTDTSSYELLDRDHPQLENLRFPLEQYEFYINCWFTLNPHHQGFDLRISQRITSIHLNRNMKTVCQLLPWLKAVQQTSGPIGCRDTYTLWLLHQFGIEAHFQVCPTLRLKQSIHPRNATTYYVDVKGQEAPQIDGHKITLSHQLNHDDACGTPLERFRRAFELLEKYARCRAVVTSRIHALLPCIAMGTPVYFIDDNRDPSRLTGYEALIQQQRQEFLRRIR